MNIKRKQVFCDWPCSEDSVSAGDLYQKVINISEDKGELLTLWGTDETDQNLGFVLHLFFVFWGNGTLYLRCVLSPKDPTYPDLSKIFPVANRLQRTVRDLLGFKAEGFEDDRSWIRHDAWPKDRYPLRHDFEITDHIDNEHDDYHFVRVGGAGVHEIAVGPVHAGIIEPGHFRFHVVGEHVLRLEELLGYAHKGVAKLFRGSSLDKGAKIAGRISGDSTVAYAWSYSMALENAHMVKAPQRSIWLRALLLERERIANHLSDLGSLGNDAGLAFAMNQFSRLKENVLRTNQILFGRRYPMDVIVPGGVNIDISQEGERVIKNEMLILQSEVNELLSIFKEHGGLQDRFVGTGIIKPDLANQLGLLGLSARASHREIDWRIQMPYEPYSELMIQYPCENEGDVAARVSLRFKELFESLNAINQIIDHLPKGKIQIELPKLSGINKGFGCVEGWRGPVFVAVCHEGDHLLWAHTHDSSCQNWPALEYAVLGNIVPDFPLINKSFNLSYSGHDC
jgi:Ni,Fe-hydrogenase III large subunit/Ni,Fe-hydrogenase III component G